MNCGHNVSWKLLEIIPADLSDSILMSGRAIVVWVSDLVCMYVIFIRCDKRTSNNKHKQRSQNDVQYRAAKPKKLFHLTKLYKEWIREDFLWRSVEYSGSWYECPRVLKLARFLVGGSKWFKACVGAHNLQNRSWSDLFISCAIVIRHWR